MEYYYLIDLKRRILTQNRVTSHYPQAAQELDVE